jgi:hypothetical protein
MSASHSHYTVNNKATVGGVEMVERSNAIWSLCSSRYLDQEDGGSKPPFSKPGPIDLISIQLCK